ncbi:type II secretion system secretin GspD [Marinicella sp. W31]|uniref:type II secretion system secretin GspD n=1 Tax=Marinicella sp. W31 TaxID=3023713 RepID=UPI0037576123
MKHNKNTSRRWMVLLVAAIITGCATQPIDLSGELEQADYLEGLDKNQYSGEVFSSEEDSDVPKEKSELYPGSGEFINESLAKAMPRAVTVQGEITFNFEGDSLQAVVHLILDEILKENYVIAPGVSGQVTFATAKPINKNQVIPILEMLLSWNNAALVVIEDRYHVVPKNQAIKGNLTPRIGALESRVGYQVMAMPLDFISPTEMETILEPYAKEGAIVKADNARNILFLAGTKRELSNYIDTINIFDVDWLAGMSTAIFYLQRVESTDIVGELEAIFGEGAGTPLAGMFRFMPLERLNAIMVITPQEEYLHKAKEWIDRLDRSGSETGNNLYVYEVKNVKADDLAGYLNDVFGGTGGSSSRSSKTNQGQVTPGQQGREISSANNRNTNNRNSSANQNRTNRRSSSANDSGIQITAIEESNQLLISANVQQYDSIMAAIKRLDIEPLQVLIEAKIIEVSLNENIAYGVQWFLGAAAGEANIDGENQPGNNVRSPDLAVIGSGVPGSDDSPPQFRYVFNGNQLQATLAALDTSGLVTVLSSPTLMVLNNKSANINVGDEIPVVSSSVGFNNGTDDNNNFANRASVRFRQTGVQLDVTPRVNPGGLVYLELTQDVSVPSDTVDSTGNRTVARREIATEIAVQSGNTVVMGGLIQENQTSSRSGLPFISRIPIIGNAFGQKSRTSDRTELMILITPTVVENPEQARRITTEYAKKFRGLRPIDNQLRNKEDDDKEQDNNE